MRLLLLANRYERIKAWVSALGVYGRVEPFHELNFVWHSDGPS